MLSYKLFWFLAFVAGTHGQSASYNYVCTYVDNLSCSSTTQSQVCGSNGVTYSSECEFTKAHCKDINLQAVSCGGPSTTAAPTTTPVSTSLPTLTTTPMSTTTPVPTDSTTISGVCQILLQQACPPDNSPVCGSDFSNYLNLCEYTKARCLNPSLTVLQSGDCSGITTPSPSVQEIVCRALASTACYDDGIVLCGSDGVTYSNSCLFERAKCQDDTLSVVKVGKC